MSAKHKTVIFVIFSCISITVIFIAIWHEITPGTGKTSGIGTCEDIAVAKGVGSAVFERKIPGASVVKIELRANPVPKEAGHIRDIYFFSVYYSQNGIKKRGMMGVDKATCRTVVTPDFP